jgi:hypothetical protein
MKFLYYLLFLIIGFLLGHLFSSWVFTGEIIKLKKLLGKGKEKMEC